MNAILKFKAWINDSEKKDYEIPVKTESLEISDCGDFWQLLENSPVFEEIDSDMICWETVEIAEEL